MFCSRSKQTAETCDARLRRLQPPAVLIGASTGPLCMPPTHPTNMPRPTILVAEEEPSQALSVRKLVFETAKFNAFTAHSTRQTLVPSVSQHILGRADGPERGGV
jgi:hypothetical protein